MQPKKLLYVPGLISLLGLPILLFLLGPEDRKYQTSLRLFLPTNDTATNEPKFTRTSVFEIIKNKQIIEVDLSDENYKEHLGWRLFNAKIDFIDREIQRLQFTHDTSSVLKIILGEENNYADFIWLINQAIIYRVKRYVYIDDCFYLLANPPPVRFEPDLYYEPIGYVEGSLEDGPTKWEEFKWWLNENMRIAGILIRYNYLLITGFLVLILIPSIAGIRKQKALKYNS